MFPLHFGTIDRGVVGAESTRLQGFFSVDGRAADGTLRGRTERHPIRATEGQGVRGDAPVRLPGFGHCRARRQSRADYSQASRRRRTGVGASGTVESGSARLRTTAPPALSGALRVIAKKDLEKAP